MHVMAMPMAVLVLANPIASLATSIIAALANLSQLQH
jgi:hypothetical protein